MGVTATTAALRWVRDVGSPALLLLLLLMGLQLHELLKLLLLLQHELLHRIHRESPTTSSSALLPLLLLPSGTRASIRASSRTTAHA